MLLKNVGDEHLASFLAGGLFLLVERSLLESGSDRAAFEPGGDVSPRESPSRTAFAPLHAVGAVLESLDAILEERHRVQALRRRSDTEIFKVFRRPFMAVRGEEQYLEAAAILNRAFGLDRVASEGNGASAVASTEEVRRLLAYWREEYGVGRSLRWHLGRAAWRALPEAARERLRPFRAPPGS